MIVLSGFRYGFLFMIRLSMVIGADAIIPVDLGDVPATAYDDVDLVVGGLWF